MAVQVEDRRTVKQDRSQPQAQANRWLYVRAKHAVHDVAPQGEAGECDTDRPDGRV